MAKDTINSLAKRISVLEEFKRKRLCKEQGHGHSWNIYRADWLRDCAWRSKHFTITQICNDCGAIKHTDFPDTRDGIARLVVFIREKKGRS